MAVCVTGGGGMKPNALTVNVRGIPERLKGEPRWVTWSYLWDQREGKKGRWTKRPHGKTNGASTWTTFTNAVAAYHTGGTDGIGFCLGNGWAGIDIDHCRVEGDDLDGARAFLRRLECYVEVSPSDTGYKAIGRSSRIGGQIDFGVEPLSFTTWTNARFFAITGAGQGDPDFDISNLINELFPQRAASINRGPIPSFIRPGDTRGTENIERFTDDQVVANVLATPQAEKFIRLVRGDTSEYGNDHSRADQALVSILAYWCQGDLEQVDRLFRQSGLMREKWNAESYRRATLAKAVRI